MEKGCKLSTRDHLRHIESGKMEILRLNKNIDGGTDPFDFPIPLGSICQYRFKHPSEYCNQTPVIIPNASESKKSEILSTKTTQCQENIGISWSGGEKDRVNIKSIKSNICRLFKK